MNLVHPFTDKRIDDLNILKSLRYIKVDLNRQFVNESVDLNLGTWVSPGVLYKHEKAQVLLRDADILSLYVWVELEWFYSGN